MGESPFICLNKESSFFFPPWLVRQLIIFLGPYCSLNLGKYTLYPRYSSWRTRKRPVKHIQVPLEAVCNWLPVLACGKGPTLGWDAHKDSFLHLNITDKCWNKGSVGTQDWESLVHQGRGFETFFERSGIWAVKGWMGFWFGSMCIVVEVCIWRRE